MEKATRKLVKAGDKLSPRAIDRLKNNAIIDAQNDTVRPKSAGPGSVRGQWVCADCGYGLANNFEAHSHTKSHRVGWWIFDTQDPHMEVP